VNSYSAQHPQSATINRSLKGSSSNISCFYEEMKGKCLFLRAEKPIPAWQTVTVEYNDTLFLGEVVICAKVNDAWKVEVKVEQILTGLQSLITLRSRLLGEDAPRSSRPVAAETVTV
jgi:hypothetical protein